MQFRYHAGGKSASRWAVQNTMNLIQLDDNLVILSDEVNIPIYDFNFELYFNCKHPSYFEDEKICILRIGPIHDYENEYQDKLTMGLRLVNNPNEHLIASEIEHWYDKISDMTPRSRWFSTIPKPEEIEKEFSWPVFMKGSRQTSKHQPELSIIENPEHFNRASKIYRNDPILHWQKVAVREFIELESVDGDLPDKIRPSLEFRSFWWFGKLVGCGQYWYQVPDYAADDIDDGLALAAEAAERLKVPFLVIDFAKTVTGDWIVIECNDGQESGYAKVLPQIMYRKILDMFSAQQDACS